MKWEIGKVYTTGKNEWLLLGEGEGQVFMRLVSGEWGGHLRGWEQLFTKAYNWREVKSKKSWSKWGQFYPHAMTSSGRYFGCTYSLYTSLDEAIRLNTSANKLRATIVQYNFEQEEGGPARIVKMQVVKEAEE